MLGMKELPDDISMGTLATEGQAAINIQDYQPDQTQIKSARFFTDVNVLIKQFNRSRNPSKYVVYSKEIRKAMIAKNPLYGAYTVSQIRDRFKYLKRSSKEIGK